MDIGLNAAAAVAVGGKSKDKSDEAINGFKDVEFLFKHDFCKPNDEKHFKQIGWTYFSFNCGF